MDQIVAHAVDYGVVGILFVMWYLERSDRAKADKTIDKLLDIGIQANKTSDILVQLGQKMTEAVDKLSAAIQLSEQLHHGVK